MINRKDIISLVHEIQRNFCAYDLSYSKKGKNSTPPSSCDCKYGANAIGTGHELGNGCPEMRDIKVFFEIMTDREYDRICKRIDKKMVKDKLAYKKEMQESMDLYKKSIIEVETDIDCV